jgi:hypothetical protein
VGCGHGHGHGHGLVGGELHGYAISECVGRVSRFAPNSPSPQSLLPPILLFARPLRLSQPLGTWSGVVQPSRSAMRPRGHRPAGMAHTQVRSAWGGGRSIGVAARRGDAMQGAQARAVICGPACLGSTGRCLDKYKTRVVWAAMVLGSHITRMNARAIEKFHNMYRQCDWNFYSDVQIVLLLPPHAPNELNHPSHHIKRSAVHVLKENPKGLEKPSFKPARLDPMYTGILSRPCPGSQHAITPGARLKQMRPGTRLDAIQKENASRTVPTSQITCSI